MGRTWSEAQVLKKLNVGDLSRKIRGKVISMETKLDKMDPEVAKAAVEKAPALANTINQSFSEVNQTLNESIKLNAEEASSYFDTCDSAVASFQAEMVREGSSFDERRYWAQQIMKILEMESGKNSENKRFNFAANALGVGALVAIALIVYNSMGSNIKIDVAGLKGLAE